MSKTFLITGGAGFVGSHLADELIARGHRVLVLDDLSTGRIENIRSLLGNSNFHFVQDSISSDHALLDLASQSTTIVHLAAAVGVKLIIENPVRTIETNVNGTEKVLKAALKFGCRVLIASTSEVYGKGSFVPFRETDDVLLGNTSRTRWAYAASKMVDEFLGFAYYREYDLPVICFRLFNTVGPRQTGQYGMVVPRLINQALQRKSLTVYGDGQQSRCFCDVADTLRAIISLTECESAVGQVYNIGNVQETTILELARTILRLVGHDNGPVSDDGDGHIVHVPYDEAYAAGFEDMRRRVPDIGKIRAATGWQPKIGLLETLERIIKYYREEQTSYESSGKN